MRRTTFLMPLKKRAAFLDVAAKGKKWVMPGVIVQVKKWPQDEFSLTKPEVSHRFGLTASKRVGNAVMRNRARRRLRALVYEILPEHGAKGYDYVLVARSATVTRDYGKLRDDLATALKRLKVWQEKIS